MSTRKITDYFKFTKRKLTVDENKGGPSQKSHDRLAKKRKKGEAKPIQAVDETLWTASRVHKASTIVKTQARKQYRVTAKDLEGLESTPYRTVVHIDGKDVATDCSLYVEHEVELLAWRKRGGPEKFEALLRKLFIANRKRNESRKSAGKAPTPFVLPYAYSPEYRPIPGYKPPVPARPSPDKYVHTSVILLNCKDDLYGDDRGWLWLLCNRIVDDAKAGCSYRSREPLLEAAVAQLKPYPRRYDPPAHPPVAFVQLSNALDLAPKGKPTTYPMVMSEKKPRYWSDALIDGIINALIRIMEVYGYRGWRIARWMVYDKYSSTFRGIRIHSYNPDIWEDQAKFWLQDRFDEDPRFFFSQEPTESWMEYKDALAKLIIKEGEPEDEDEDIIVIDED
ncbi:hypothetical protein M422DRAFT_778625 [Sphaerobolus stellatus SS14]|uniref:Uncharacterized protein n=1 Tax=Sphaerobolus stellatus (strain SS14) TaxID=990650 RepID=A0A0C9W3P4_SPHS4|nr:hypothetical protein M422DRAFT_778625 [Sphaerobolus stellatus SS14]